ncbi:alpha/beta hydrolase [Actinobacillus succinogenes]|uniref:Kmt1 n=1 Tax=Actinobacillus succinogenes (strain ATCC 55618 / DSM 22257 / CCUG 43843 / 130Z) TaxID=339671 RepID=A6VKJ9_ACTSZ|nr:alpha/beta hydrolase [Actinobacillus succinogenes]ABR73496.1 kmt1 [Actinobacillus succinogenes 130Z]PHI40040.1 alpha/beta hydrolase [Actinobacillus succinogenes]
MMKRNSFRAIVFLIFSFVGAYFAHQIERDFGRIDVYTVSFITEENHPMVAKLYRPISAIKDTPKPGLLALHGYQSDKEATNTFGALELAKRGFVVLAIDHFGHGYSTALPAANKNMSGANNGYQYLKSLPFVDKERLGIFGHSTGALNAIGVAKLNPDHKAVNGQSSNGGDPSLHNYLVTQGLYEEIGGYREKSFPVKELVKNEARLKAFNLPINGQLQWNHTYGDFADGSARRAALVNGTHLGVMIAEQTNKEAILWFNQTLQNGVQDADWIDPDRQTYWYKEFAGLFALFSALVSALFLANGLLRNSYFCAVTQTPSKLTALSQGKWWAFALVNVVMTMILYPLFTQWGGANEPIASIIPFMPLEMGNGIILWLVVSAMINYLFFLLWKRNTKVSLREFGVLTNNQGVTTPQIVIRHFILAVILIIYLYGITSFVHTFWGVELRFLWPLLKPLTAERFMLFPVYWLLILLFFFSFNGLIATVQMRMKQAESFAITLLSWTVKTNFFAVSGLILLWLFHFVPDFMQIGPGFDIVGLPQFGGRWMMMLAVIIPQFIVFIFLNHWCYLKTGYVYLGVFLTSMLMAWIIVGGQVIGRFLG